MLKNHLTVAARHLWRHRGYSLVNVAGLAVGLASCFLLALYVRDELSYDRFNEKASRIQRVGYRFRSAGTETSGPNAPMPFAAALKAEFPEVEQVTRVISMHAPGAALTVSNDNEQFYETRVYRVDANFFDVFSFPLLRGDAATVLAQPDALVLSASAAHKYFGDADPIGRPLVVDLGMAPPRSYVVRGVAEDAPSNAHFHFDFLLPLAGYAPRWRDDWYTMTTCTYVVLEDGYDARRLEAKLPSLVRKYGSTQAEQGLGMSLDALEASGGSFKYTLQPLVDIHLHPFSTFELEPQGDATRVYTFAAIAVVILLLAGINFTNLATARASSRGLEVGVRKALGAARRDIVRRFLVESVLQGALALAFALALLATALPAFDALAGKDVTFGQVVADPVLLAGMVGLVLVIGVLAGSHPAFVLSAFGPIAALEGQAGSGRYGHRLRTALVGTQLVVTIALLAATFVMRAQITYMLGQDLGFDDEQVVVLPHASAVGNQRDAFRGALAQDPGVVSTAFTSSLPGRPAPQTGVIPEESPTPDMRQILVFGAYYGMTETLGIHVKAGHDFSPDHPPQRSDVLVNEAAVRAFGWKGNPIGRRIDHPGGPAGPVLTVVGVMKDFHFESLHEPVRPLMVWFEPQAGRRQFVTARIETQHLSRTLAAIARTWHRFAPDKPYTYSFLDQDFDALYRADRVTARVLAVFAAMAVFVACLGLLGLAAFYTQQRTKEIGVRKVLGASVGGLAWMMARWFVLLIVAAFTVAAPLAYFAMRWWLNDYAYRVDATPWPYVTAGALALIAALAAVGFHVVKAARANPAVSLRSE